MRTPVWLGIAGAVALACLAFGATYKYAGSVPAHFFSEAVAAEPASSHVRIKAGPALGSGTHIGDGFVLTAAHVVAANKTVTVEGDNGSSYEAEVLWTNTAFDVSLVRIAGNASVGVSPLSCAPNFIGQKVQAFGNPMGVAFVYTKGEVNGAARQHGAWKRVVPLDMTTIYGQSGGGIIDEAGNVVGVTVGLLPTQFGISAFGWAVPGEAICALMGRTA